MQIRQYKPGDEKQILEMDWLLFPDPWNKRNLENWRWKHKGNNPAGDAIIYVMEHEAMIIAHFAVVPYRIRAFGRDVLASHSIGSMVLPEYQGKGLIKFVADKLFKEAQEKNIAFSYGFPNNLAYDLHKRFFGYDDISQIYTLEKKTTPLVSKKDNTVSGKFRFAPITRFNNSSDQLWDASKDTYPISVIRDKAFLNWRYMERPDQKYYGFGAYEGDELTGYAILKLYQDAEILKGHIIDVFSLPDRRDIVLFLIEKSEEFFIDNKTDIESSWVMGSGLYEGILRDKGFKPVRPRPLICRLNLDKDAQKEVLDSKNWYFTMGDTTEIF